MQEHLTDEELDDFFDSTMTGDEAERIKRHASSCDACAARIEAMREWLQHTRALAQDLPPVRDLFSRIAAGVELRRRRRRILVTITQVAASVAIFLAGAAAGYAISAHRAHLKGNVAAVSQPRIAAPADGVALDIQRKGSDYVAALSALSRVNDDRMRLQGREVALSTIYGAIFEIERSTGRLDVLRAVAAQREETSNQLERINAVRF